MTTLRIGTRGSTLALTQTGMVADDLADAYGVTTELVTITTDGDRSNEPLSRAGGTGLFTGALRDALLAGECDVIVHSLKDLPTAPHDQLVVAAIPAREDPRDALIARDGLTLDELPAGARVGTGSPRRMAQLRARRPDLEVVDIRGNVDTRLGKVTSGELDAVILAAAGLTRIGRTDVVTEFLDPDRWPTAPGQGALAVEVRLGEERLVDRLDHTETRAAVEAEREVLALLEAGCSAPVGARAVVDAGLLLLSASVYSLDGTTILTSSHATVWPADEGDPSREVAASVARELLDAGAAGLTGERP
ncbi:hydroxymethylbilane synthase [Microbacterium trichothecenolyticum]|uniref:Porphobilinogen deaminase n=1 Tax=Microbacterium ureisolvens TaxID=2781186 RepID=A0ABS7I3Z2_9MICO|nr:MULTISPECIES: hydroxymethylbilane synthase [Microbacterium]MBW9111497.1 hydroxymethylbilane synthase [Microbacterium ureisolvens]MBW9121745.1 hydroxymethylbilane synthase [Microbacterium trichothecenolyticum]